MKKIFALVLAMLLVAGMFSALADNGSVTISSPDNGDTGSTYSLWKLFDITDVGGGVYVYTPVAAYKDSIISAVNTVVGASTLSATSTDSEIQTAVANISSEADKKALADALYDLVYAADQDGDLQISAATGSISGTNATVPVGYYVIGETTIGAYDGGAGVATRPMLYTVTTAGITPTTKESYPTPSKIITASEGGSVEDDDSATAQIGKDVTFQLKATLPSNFADYDLGYYLQFHDTLSAGLKYKETVSVTVGGQDALTSGDGSYVFNNPTWVDSSATTLTWTWADISKDTNAGANKEVVITYKATVTGDAIIGSTGNPNTLKITYSNNPTNTGHGDSKTIEVKVYAFQIKVYKKDDTGAPLPDAEFVLKNAGGKYYQFTKGVTDDLDSVAWVDAEADATVLVSNNNGNMYLKGDTTKAAATFKGLPEGSYTLHETQAPSTYNVADDVTITITATAVAGNDSIQVSHTGATSFDSDTYLASVDVIDRHGGTLPTTGGIGTTLFYVGGGILVLLAGVLLITKRRMNANND